MAHPVSPLDKVLREAMRPKCVLNHHPCGVMHWAWDPIDGWHCDMRLPRRDPIFTPLFTAILGTGGFTLFGATISYAAIASAIAVTALSIGLQYALAPKPPKPEDGRAPLAQPVPYRFWGVGECRLAGSFMLWEGVDDKLVSVQAIVAHAIDSITGIYLQDDHVTVNASGVVQPIGDRYKGDLVKIWTRLGAVPETAYSRIVSLLESQGIWTNNHRGDGQASLAMTCGSPEAEDFTSRFPYGRPQASIVGKLAKVWDFRDPSQSPTNPGTWKWSNNSVLILAWHLCFNQFGEKQDYRRAILPAQDMWQEEANVCDELVPLASGGTEKRYTCSGYDTTEHGPKSATNAILATMDGWMCTRGDGAVLVVAGKYREKYCASLTDADVVGYVNQRDVLFDEEINRFTPKFNYPATDYSTTDTDFFEDTAAQLRAGRPLPEEGHYDWCTQWRQARRLGKRDWTRIQQKSRGSIYANLTGINAACAPWIRLETPVMIPALNGKVISNRKATINLMKGGYQVDFVKMPDNPADIDAWDPDADEGSAPPVPIKPVSEGLPVPTIDSIAVVSHGGSVNLRVSLIDPNRSDVIPTIRYRISGGNWIDQNFKGAAASAGLIVLNTNPVPGDQNLEVQAAFIGSNGKTGTYSASQFVTSTVDTTAPQALLTFSTTDGSGQFVANVGTANDGHLVSVAIYRVASGGAISPRPTPVAHPAVSPGISYAIPVAAPAGTWDIYAEPINRSGIAGPLSGPAAVTVS